MNAARGTYLGVWNIVRFNWPMYLTAIAVLLITSALCFITADRLIFWIGICIILGALYFLVGSLGVSHWIYDRSQLYRWSWFERAVQDNRPACIALCHAGFDEVSCALIQRFPNSQWHLLDHFDPSQMTEASIHRARRTYPPPAETLQVAYNRWPQVVASLDVVFAMFAIHELRRPAERAAWFREAADRLNPQGRIVLVEHVRDLANFLAFGPGFLHFHARSTWQRDWQSAGLKLTDEFRITPWVRVFVLSHDA